MRKTKKKKQKKIQKLASINLQIILFINEKGADGNNSAKKKFK